MSSCVQRTPRLLNDVSALEDMPLSLSALRTLLRLTSYKKQESDIPGRETNTSKVLAEAIQARWKFARSG